MNLLQKAINITLSLSTISLALLSPSFDTRAFAHESTIKDIHNHWAENSIIRAQRFGYFTGYPDHTFRPDTSITAAEFVVALSRALKLEPQPTAEGKSSWYSPYLNTLQAEQIFHTEDFLRNPSLERPITRIEMAKMIARVLNPDLKTSGDSISYIKSQEKEDYHINKLKLQSEKYNLNLPTVSYKDEFNSMFPGLGDAINDQMYTVDPKQSNLSYTWIDQNYAFFYLVVKDGIFNGKSGGKLAENENTTRAEVTVVLDRLLQKRQGAQLKTDNTAIQNARIEMYDLDSPKTTTIFSSSSTSQAPTEITPLMLVKPLFDYPVQKRLSLAFSEQTIKPEGSYFNVLDKSGKLLFKYQPSEQDSGITYGSVLIPYDNLEAGIHLFNKKSLFAFALRPGAEAQKQLPEAARNVYRTGTRVHLDAYMVNDKLSSLCIEAAETGYVQIKFANIQFKD